MATVNEWQRGSARRGKVSVGLIVLLAVLAVGAVGYWVWVARDSAVPPPPPEESRVVTLYHVKTGKAIEVKGADFDALATRDDRYEYPAGSGKFDYRRKRPGGVQVIGP